MERDADTSMMADRNNSERLGDFCFWTDGWMNKQTDISYMQTDIPLASTSKWGASLKVPKLS